VVVLLFFVTNHGLVCVWVGLCWWWRGLAQSARIAALQFPETEQPASTTIQVAPVISTTGNEAPAVESESESGESSESTSFFTPIPGEQQANGNSDMGEVDVPEPEIEGRESSDEVS
jgi:hypothetical protein